MSVPLNDVFKAIADPIRREILRLLRHEEMSTGTWRRASTARRAHALEPGQRPGLVCDLERSGGLEA
ncbi:hypothetical protein [Massilia niastensis]|uniref:hypothetical protein n=1 Tax=Massilia niastensis TaxID=544911 RepID=UPI0003829398|nr:hypothetical protein [Massilia niastensis]